MNFSYKKLIGHSFNYGLGSVLPQAIGFLLIPVYTRVLTKEDYGILELVSTLIMFVTPLIKLGLPGAITRFYFDYEKEISELRNLIKTIHILIIYGGLLLCLLLSILMYFIQPIIAPEIPLWPYLVLALITSFTTAYSHIQKKIIQNRQESRLNLILQVLFSFTNIGLTIVLVLIFSMGALGSILATTIASILMFLQAMIYLRKDLRGHFSREKSREVLRYGGGILPHQLANHTGNLIIKSLLLAYASLFVLGTYSVALRFVAVLLLVSSSLQTAAVPFYHSARKKNKDEEVTNLIKNVLILAFIAYSIFVLFMPIVMQLVLPHDYHDSIRLVPILSLAFLGKMLYQINIVEVFFLKKTRFISLVTITGMLLGVLVFLALIDYIGIDAICWAFVADSLAMAIASFFLKAKYSDFKSYRREQLLFFFPAMAISVYSILIYSYA